MKSSNFNTAGLSPASIGEHALRPVLREGHTMGLVPKALATLEPANRARIRMPSRLSVHDAHSTTRKTGYGTIHLGLGRLHSSGIPSHYVDVTNAISIKGNLVTTALRNLESAKKELVQLHEELLRLERRANSVCESLRETITELFGPDRQAFPALQEATFAARVAEAVLSRLPVTSQVPGGSKQYIRERDAARYMGVSVATLRRWRTLRTKAGPPFTRLGQMVMYSSTALEEHMRARLVPYRD